MRQAGRGTSKTFWAYVLLQTPDILLAAVALWFLVRWGWLSVGWALGLFAVWVAKDVALYPVVRDTFRRSPVGSEGLIGARGIVGMRLAPRGEVHVAGELWRAQSVRSGEAISAGTPVVVRAVRGLTLLVEAEAPSPPAARGEPTGS